ncbi:hypothetical protein BD324DRAFT_647914 [Kockovaella imperatae]|uniref:Mitochondrial outer membrane protein OM14 C-terminal domain-containing protein n=1 Tax=Kockovaella imperatae TaxID=4999 RepID=A0A1Y1UU01_9TREE|nr:hypothetical protein BD324DRAFT_647914 [Kockovaella imperatae]ORX41014.1 hypothetical protein BD324DRAFT_647914 [Kockovaella imperatae]
MSYASVASHNIPFGEMPKPDPHLADGATSSSSDSNSHPTFDSKINVLPPGSDPNHPDYHPTGQAPPEPVTLHPADSYQPHTSDSAPTPLPAPHKKDINMPESGESWQNKGKKMGRKAGDELDHAEGAAAQYWEKTKDVVLRPGTLGGLMGVVNVGILGTLGYYAYTRRDQPWDRRIVGGAVAGTLALFGAEGYVADSYLDTAEGRAEAERAKREGSRAYLRAKEVILRPGVFGGLAGILNLGVLGTLGYYAYENWHRHWDRRTLSYIAVGLLTLSGLEGWAGKEYADHELPKRQ